MRTEAAQEDSAIFSFWGPGRSYEDRNTSQHGTLLFTSPSRPAHCLIVVFSREPSADDPPLLRARTSLSCCGDP